MTNDDKDLKKLLENKGFDTEAIEDIFWCIKEATPQQPSEPLKALDIDRIGSKIRARVGEVLCLTLTEQNKVATANDNHTKRIKTD